MKFIIPYLLLCLTVVGAQEAMPLQNFKGVYQEAGAGKGYKPVTGGLKALQKQISDLQSKTANANNSIVPFKGGSLKGLVGLLKVNEAVVQLGKTIDTATDTAEATDPLSANESTQIGVQFLALQPDITNLITNLKGKRKEFDKAGFKILDVRSLIRDSVTIQKDKAGDLGTAFTKVLNAQFQPIASQISDQIQGNFSDAIDAYQGRGGKIKIPTKAVPKLSALLAAVAKALGINSSGKMVADGLVADADSIPMTTYQSAEAAFADIDAADTVEANTAVEAAMEATSDADLLSLGPDENDLRGISPLVLAVLRRYDII